MERAPFYSEIADAPANGRAHWIYTEDGLRLRVAIWKAENPEKGSILVFPGRTEFVETFGRTVADFEKFGYSSFVIDWRGHGLSDRVAEDPITGHVNRFSDYHKDVAAMIKAAHELDLPKPWYLVGNSMGACIGLRALIDGLPVAACAFCAPMWDIELSPVQRLAAWPVSWTAQMVGKGQTYAPGHSGESYILSVGFPDNRRTNDPDMYQYMVNQAQKAPDLHTGGPSMGWLYQTLTETRSLSKMPSPELPCITFCPDHDELISVPAVRERMARWPGGRIEIIQDAKHNLLLEPPEIRESVMTKICELFSAERKNPGPSE
ncbi:MULTISPECIES: alpha/beta hydrolase [Litoreibacter]|uniref:Lysophospholipase n=1 Tax=Litoreibacter ascidiaceicola TaxID=1486859 RepID=A0A1M5DKA5_9RHOB|nr:MULTISPECIES: alpha/beta hydrolase [Litoreibacter]SHF67380.1 lysophospholipase [Litoreibacter ascidiaceicola]